MAPQDEGSISTAPTATLDGSDDRSDDAALAPGDVLAGRYRIVKLLARGGMGAVYSADDTVLHEQIALKTLRAEVAADDRAVVRFKREIQLARRVAHGNVCRVFELGQHPRGERRDLLFLTMELLSGETLSARLAKGGAMDTAAARPIAEQIVAGLTAAHDAGIIHRDLKSANVMIVPGKTGERVVVTDFGLARDPGAGGDVETTGAIVGSPGYMAPEQVEGGRIGTAADIYALGVVLYELVTGRLPFIGETPLQTAVKRLTETPAPPERHAPGLPAAWSAAIMRCLARDPTKRFTAARDVLAALDGAAAPRGKRWVIAAGIAGLLVAGAGATVFALRGGSGAEASPARRVLVVPPRGGAAWLGVALAEELAARLDGAADLRAVPPAETAAALRDLELPPTDAYTRDNLARLAVRTGADLVIAGSASDERVALHVQDTATGETIARVEAGRATDPAVRGAVLATGVCERLHTTCRGADPHALPSPAATRAYVEGLTAARAFDPVTARERLRDAAAIDPTSARVQLALADALLAIGDPTGAATAATSAEVLAASLPAIARARIAARHHELAGDAATAAALWQALYALDGDPATALAWIRARAAAGDPAGALAMIAELRVTGTDPRLAVLEAELASFSDPERARAAVDSASASAAKRRARGLEADALALSAWLAWTQGDLDRAGVDGEKARALHALLGARRALAADLGVLGASRWQQGKLDEAARLLGDVVRIARETENRAELADSENNLGVMLASLGRHAEAETHFAAAVAVRPGYAVPEMGRAWMRIQRGELEAGQKALETALAAPDHEPYPRAFFLIRLGEVRALRGERVGARAALAEARTVAMQAGGKLLIAEAQVAEATILAAETRLAEAETLARAAVGDLERLRAAGIAARAWALISSCARRRGDLASAHAALARATAADAQHDHPADRLRVAIESARLASADGKRVEAEAILQRAESATAGGNVAEQAADLAAARAELGIATGSR